MNEDFEDVDKFSDLFGNFSDHLGRCFYDQSQQVNSSYSRF